MPQTNFDVPTDRGENVQAVNVNKTENGFTARIGEFSKTQNELAIKYYRGRFGAKPSFGGYMKTSPDEVFYFDYSIDSDGRPKVLAGYARRNDEATRNYVDFPTYPNPRDNRALYFLNPDEHTENGDRWNEILDRLSEEAFTSQLESAGIHWDPEELNKARAKTEEVATETPTAIPPQQEIFKSEFADYEVLPAKNGTGPVVIRGENNTTWFVFKRKTGAKSDFHAVIYDPNPTEGQAARIWVADIPELSEYATEEERLNNRPEVKMINIQVPFAHLTGTHDDFSTVNRLAEIESSNGRAEQINLGESDNPSDPGVWWNNAIHRGIMKPGGTGSAADDLEKPFKDAGIGGLRESLKRAYASRPHWQS